MQSFIDGDYAKYQRVQFKAAYKTLNRLKIICKDFGETRLDAITAWNLEKWRAKRIKAGRSKETANRDLAMQHFADYRQIDRFVKAMFCRVPTGAGFVSLRSFPDTHQGPPERINAVVFNELNVRQKTG